MGYGREQNGYVGKNTSQRIDSNGYCTGAGVVQGKSNPLEREPMSNSYLRRNESNSDQGERIIFSQDENYSSFVAEKGTPKKDGSGNNGGGSRDGKGSRSGSGNAGRGGCKTPAGGRKGKK